LGKAQESGHTMRIPKDAIWLMLLVAILLLLIQTMHGQEPKYGHVVEPGICVPIGAVCKESDLTKFKASNIRRRAEKQIEIVERGMKEWYRLPHAYTGSDEIYIIRAEIDVQLIRNILHHHGELDVVELKRLMKQLDRDMEDYPPQEAKR
jgi:hypothetical protein